MIKSIPRLLGTYCIMIVSVILFTNCTEEKVSADTILINGNIWTVDSTLLQAEALAIKEGKIFQVGDNSEVIKVKGAGTRVIDVEGAFVMPGFIEGHGHFSGLGFSLINLNFLNAKNWEEIVSMVKRKAEESEQGVWIEGRGWHQEKWDTEVQNAVLGYPLHNNLSDASPDNPVILYHASGHSLFANKKAMDIAGVSRETADPVGGEIVKDSEGNPIGVFEERAMQIIRNAHKSYKEGLSQEDLTKQWYEAIELAEQECIQKGVTSFQDAGSQMEEIDRYKKLAEDGELDLRLWSMIRHSHEEMKDKIADYKMIGVGENFFTCRAIKSEVDGALGAFGAWLLKPYNDKADFIGQNTTDIYEVRKIADLAINNDMQLCVHAIGDRANRTVIDIYEGMMELHPEKSDVRWRIEHAQHLDTTDIPRFKKYNIIASMQGIHCTSDAPFVEKRLGTERAKKGAYAWRSLLDHGVTIANGTDAPVEDVDPIQSFYASVTRKRADNGLEFFTEQSMSREEAIKSYTLDNAYAAFEENIKGSISIGKVADLVVLSKDLINCSDDEILNTEILYTFIDGEIKYSSFE